ncbi:ClpP/crotonase-like domain-containing protein [Zopfochytrium polystomum]|nr:ClpP/crotonase-like domain-containing protein [Zopfochytrium polystomum]
MASSSSSSSSSSSPAAAAVAAPLQLFPTSREDLVATVDALCAKLLKYYVLGDEVASKIATAVRARLDAGAYDEPATSGDMAALADLLTKDLQSVNGDKHLYVRRSEAVVDEEKDLTTDPNYGPKADEEQGKDDDDGKDDEEQIPPMMREMFETLKVDGTSFHDVRRLKGNVGVIRFKLFAPGNAAKKQIDAAFELVRYTSALILDLRDGLGGDGEMADYVMSFLLEKPTPLVNIYWRPQDYTMTTKSRDFSKKPQYLNRPVYVLTTSKTFSACEKFAVVSQALGATTVVGQTTAGGGHPCSHVRIHDHLLASISIGKTTCIATGKGWEGVGCVPNVPVPAEWGADAALTVAHLEAARLVAKAVDQIPEAERRRPSKALAAQAAEAIAELEAVAKGYETAAAAAPAESAATDPAAAPAETVDVVVDVEAETAPTATRQKKHYAPGLYFEEQADGTYDRRSVRYLKLFGIQTQMQYHRVTSVTKEAAEAEMARIAAREP